MTDNISTDQEDLSLIRKAVIYLGFLAFLLPLNLFSLFGQLFGPTWTFFLGIAGFVSAIAVFILTREAPGEQFVRVCPHGLSERFPKLRSLEIPLRRVMKLVGLVAAAGLITLAVTARLDGVPSTPVFLQRTHYVLVNHSANTEVSRLRYCLAGTGFHVGWHFGALYTILLAIYALVFARIPKKL